MAIKLSPTQIEVLVHMEKGFKLYAGSQGAPWVQGMPDPKSPGLPRRIRSTTWGALWDKKCIRRVDTEKTPWYRRDYAITDQGVEALRLLGILPQLPLEELE